MAAMKDKYKDLDLDSAIGDVSVVIELGREVSMTDSHLPMEQRISQAAAKLLVDKAASPELREKLTLDQKMHDALKNDPSRNFEFQIYEKNPELYVLLKLKASKSSRTTKGSRRSITRMGPRSP